MYFSFFHFCCISPFLVASGSINLLQWNPHWQCFVWNETDCAGHAERLATEMLQTHAVDFGNFVEFDDSNFSFPKGWAAMRTSCGVDQVALVHNSLLWMPSMGNGTNSVGCMVSSDRPFIVQAFHRVNSSKNGSTRNTTPFPPAVAKTNSTEAEPEEVIVIGAHFPHPETIFTKLSNTLVAQLRNALHEVVNATGIQNVILIADTNEYTFTPSSEIASYLDFPGHTSFSTSLERTCCYDSGFPRWGAFDRVLANFGGTMQTNVLMQLPIPDWAQQIQNGTGRKGAFHRPILGVLSMEPPPESIPRRFGGWPLWMMAAVLVAVGAASAGYFLLKGDSDSLVSDSSSDSIYDCESEKGRKE